MALSGADENECLSSTPSSFDETLSTVTVGENKRVLKLQGFSEEDRNNLYAQSENFARLQNEDIHYSLINAAVAAQLDEKEHISFKRLRETAMCYQLSKGAQVEQLGKTFGTLSDELKQALTKFVVPTQVADVNIQPNFLFFPLHLDV